MYIFLEFDDVYERDRWLEEHGYSVLMRDGEERIISPAGGRLHWCPTGRWSGYLRSEGPRT